MGQMLRSIVAVLHCRSVALNAIESDSWHSSSDVASGVQNRLHCVKTAIKGFMAVAWI